MATMTTYTHHSPAPSRATRAIPKASKGHFVGQLVFDRDGFRQTLGFASLLEHDAALCLIYRPDFADLEEQVGAVPFRLPNGKTSHHTFDFRLTLKHGNRIAIAVKPEEIAETYEFKAGMRAIRKATVPGVAHEMCVVTERNIHPVALHNAKLFHAARNAQPDIDDTVRKAVETVSDPIRINDFLHRTGIGGAGFYSVARCIRHGHAVQADDGLITGDSLIMAGTAV